MVLCLRKIRIGILFRNNVENGRGIGDALLDGPGTERILNHEMAPSRNETKYTPEDESSERQQYFYLVFRPTGAEKHSISNVCGFRQPTSRAIGAACPLKRDSTKRVQHRPPATATASSLSSGQAQTAKFLPPTFRSGPFHRPSFKER